MKQQKGSGMLWLVGIEDTAIGVPIRHSGRTLDEYELTEHDRNVVADLERAASLGVDGLRYGLPWYRVNPEPEVYRWDLVDPAMIAAERLGLKLIIDLVHYGVPAWVEGGFIDPRYPEAVAAYAGAFAARYGRSVTRFTPLNEPAVTAAFCGETGGWPPYLSGLRGWTAVTLALVDGIQRTVSAIRACVPEATIVHVEAAKLVRPTAPHLAAMAELARQRAWLPTDLVLGRVDETHPLWGWLLEQGADPGRLAAVRANAVDVDVIGVNFYPQYSVRTFRDLGGDIVDVAGGGTTDELLAVMRAFAERYGRPVGLTETSYDGDDAARSAWLEASAAALGAGGSDELAPWCYTWWPLFDFVDWGIAAGDRPLEDFLVSERRPDGSEELVSNALTTATLSAGEGVTPWLKRMGLWRLEPSADGLARIETPVAETFRRLAAGSPRPVGLRCRR